jgi:ABC-type transport system involved in multi-copper enzyme maturation permease subunit
MTGGWVKSLRVPPLIEREMRAAARRWTTYWGRVTLLLVALVPVMLAYAVGEFAGRRSTLGLELLLGQAGILFAWVLLTGIQLAGDAVSAEKREGTLGLLFLTQLKSFDIVMGKLVALSMRTWHGLLGVIPALAVPLMVGGATLGDALRLSLILGNALFLSVAVTLLISTFCRRQHAATGWAAIVLGLLMGGIPLAQAIGARDPWLNLLNLANPVMPLWSFPAMTYQLDPAVYWQQIAAAHGLGWCLVGGTTYFLPRVWQDRPAMGGTIGDWRVGWRQWWLGTSAQRRRFRATALEHNPVYWYVSRDRRAAWMPWIFVGLVFGGMAAAHVVWPSLSLDLGIFWFLGWCVQLVFKAWVASVAGRTFAVGGEAGAIELLLATPLTNRELIAGGFHGLVRRFLGPSLLIVLGQLVAISWLASRQALDVHDAWFTVYLFYLLTFLLEVMAVGMVGLWKGVVCKNASQAMAGTLWWVLVLPWFGTLGLTVLGAVGPGRMDSDSLITMLFAISILMSLVLAIWARCQLEEKLRETVCDRLAGAEPWLRGWRLAGRTLGEMFGRRRIGV